MKRTAGELIGRCTANGDIECVDLVCGRTCKHSGADSVSGMAAAFQSGGCACGVGIASSAVPAVMGDQFLGRFDNAPIFTNALTATQVLSLYNAAINAQSLSVRRAGNNVQVNWINGAGFSLESKTNLSQLNWNVVTNTPVLSNGVKTVALRV